MSVVIGTAGWTLPRASVGRFPLEGSHLQRYASVLPGVEINSSFYKPHRTTTYARWAASVPAHFRFSVKVPKHVTHELRLVKSARPFAKFLAEARHLGDKLGPLLVQLPPSLELDLEIATAFFAMVRKRHDGPIAFEPRHPTWFTPQGDALLEAHDIARVRADPLLGPPHPTASLAYFRLHGSPRMYYSAYDDDALRRFARERTSARETWFIFDNTALGAATEDALRLGTRSPSTSIR